MNKPFGLILFLAGAAVGSAASWLYAKKKYEKIAQEEIDSVKEVFTHNAKMKKDEDGDSEDRVEEDPEEDTDDRVLYRGISHQYRNYSNSERGNDQEKVSPVDKPYVISPDEFGEDDFDTVTFTFYSDHTVTDENDEVLEDMDEVIGVESLNHFGEYEDDAVYVRNPRLKLDIEILLDNRSYSEILESKPYLRRPNDEE